jgi:UDP-N-acetylmuramate dehydrogenase
MVDAKLPDFVERDVDLGTRNTLALPGRAAFYAEVDTADQLTQLAGRIPGRRFILGGGSNLLLSGDYDGVVLRMAIAGRELVGEDDDAWYVRAGAGENWHEFVAWTLDQGWPGLENLALIPGTVGATPVQNIGAYGVEVAERFHSLTACDLATGKLRHFDREQLRFGYRDSLFKQQGWHLDGALAISAVTFRLPKSWQPITRYGEVEAELAARSIAVPDARQIFEAIVAIRRRKLPDPAQLPNAGSFFHNPLVDAATAQRLLAEHPGLPCYAQLDGRSKLAAGWLIERAGWKGRGLGPVGMYEKQALVLVNRGGATGSDVVALMRAVARDVRQQFGVDLTPEPVLL